jgi:lysozyme family protein
MVASNFERSLKLTLRYEGGFSSDPHDPGGDTNFGITHQEYDKYRSANNLPQQSVRNITVDEYTDIYRNEYWNAMHCDDLPNGTDFVTFDAAVNSGTGRAAQWLKASNGDIDKFCDLRLAFLKRLSTWKYFGSGWASRVRSVRLNAHMMAAVPSDDIKQIQQALNERGFRLAVDGLCGERTDLAIRQFQAANGLVADGIVGAKTREILFDQDEQEEDSMPSFITNIFLGLLGNAQVQAIVRKLLTMVGTALLLKFGVDATTATNILDPIITAIAGGVTLGSSFYLSAQNASPLISNPTRIDKPNPTA